MSLSPNEQADLADNEAWFAQMKADAEATLHPDLEPYVETNERWAMLRHPLVYQVPFTLPGLANRAYEVRSRELEEFIAAGEWERAVWAYERPWRQWALVEYVVGRDEEGRVVPLAGLSQEVRDLAADVWVDSENLQSHTDWWADMFRERRPDGGLLLGSVLEEAELAAMPDRLTVYRGDIDDGGWSWSLDPKTAYFFAHRFGADDPLICGTVAKADVFGYLSRRSESEVLCEPDVVVDVHPYDYVKEGS